MAPDDRRGAIDDYRVVTYDPRQPEKLLDDIAEASAQKDQPVSMDLRTLRRALEMGVDRALLAEIRMVSPGILGAHTANRLVDEWTEGPFHPDEMDPGPNPSVIALRMESPLQAVLEIPLVTWPALAIGLLALTERIATMPVRISRKRKQELLKSAIVDKQTQLVVDSSADVLARLLLREGPDRRISGPSEVTFLDPDDPSEELEPVALEQ